MSRRRETPMESFESSGALSRREVLRYLAAGVAGSTLLPFIANAMPERRIRNIGLQLYTVRSAMAKDLEGTLDAIAKAGITELEFAGYYNKDAAWWTAALKKRGLRAPSTHEGLPAADDGWNAIFQRAAQMGHELVIVPSVGNNYRGTKANVQKLCERLNVGAEKAKEFGLMFGYHNHDGEFAPMEGTTMWDVLTSETDAALVKLELDCYWATKAGRKPLEIINQWPGRIVAVHVKDATPAPELKMTEVGAGIIDYKAILADGRANGLQWWFIEHDNPTDAIASITASAAAMKKL
ncbi:MAG: sugar phosphate isomerase/epimerase [Gemmatimonadaceae bacterium]|nr:sugar phosphate isomerase/epimerase [Gemmatimonadaceae bacterium]